jgi:L-aminopeptidase/D-esterase-like protein
MARTIALAHEDVSGDSIFVSAAAATQFLINVCGLSNVKF